MTAGIEEVTPALLRDWSLKTAKAPSTSEAVSSCSAALAELTRWHGGWGGRASSGCGSPDVGRRNQWVTLTYSTSDM